MSPTPRDGDLPSKPPPSGGRRTGALYTAIALVAALAVVAAVVVATGVGGDDGRGARGADVGAALGTATITPANVGTVRPDSTSTSTTGRNEGGGSSGAPGTDLPPVTIPAEASPPTTIPGSEPSSVPTDIFSGEEAPQFGTLVVDLEPGGHQDVAVHLRDDQEIQLLSLGDDGIQTHIEVFGPDGSSEGAWEGGEPEVVNGLEWYLPDEPLPATGTYVIRVIHTGGAHGPFALGFFGNA